MPLSKPAARRQMHRREITCTGFLRDDGQWDVEGHLKDTKGYDFDNHERGTILAGEPVHEMSVRLTVDDTFLITCVEVVTDHAPFGMCGEVAPVFERLVGLRIETGWNRTVRRLVGGVQGCTHIVELLGPLATTVLQTVRPSRNIHTNKDDAEKGDAFDAKAVGARPRILDTCHSLSVTSPVVKRLWPEFHEGE